MIASSTDLPSLTDIHLPDSFEFKEDIKTASDALNLCSLLDVPEAFKRIATHTFDEMKEGPNTPRFSSLFSQTHLY